MSKDKQIAALSDENNALTAEVAEWKKKFESAVGGIDNRDIEIRRLKEKHSSAWLQSDAQITTLKAALGVFESLEENDWDLRCINVPTGGGDYSIQWVVIEHHMSKPKERDIGIGNQPIKAIQAALKNTLKGGK